MSETVAATPPPITNPATAAPNHSNRVDFDENCMSTGMAVYSAIALRHLDTTRS